MVDIQIGKIVYGIYVQICSMVYFMVYVQIGRMVMLDVQNGTIV